MRPGPTRASSPCDAASKKCSQTAAREKRWLVPRSYLCRHAQLESTRIQKPTTTCRSLAIYSVVFSEKTGSAQDAFLLLEGAQRRFETVEQIQPGQNPISMA